MADILDRLKAALADRYRIERELSSGGMATVYLAQDLKHERQVAVKVLRPELAAALGSERFLREIKIAANLNHPHILPLHDSGEADGFLFYVMPYVEGESLRDRLNREKQLPIADALKIATEVADALGFAHDHNVIHRDIKPENILLEAKHAVVADFGVARAIEQAGETRLTETGIAIGTPAYLSPEQASGERELDGRSDVYSLGCVLYEMLVGEPPYTGPTVQAIVAKKLSAATPRVSVVRERVPRSVEAAIYQALAKVPADRFAAAEAFVAALERPQVTPIIVLRRAMKAVGMMLGVAAAILGVWWTAQTLGAGRAARPVDPQAHRYFLAGEALLDRSTIENARQAIEHFEQAIALDSSFASAYAAAAEAYLFIASDPYDRPINVLPDIKRFARKAIELDPDLPNAHAVLGWVRWMFDYDYEEAELALRRAIDLGDSTGFAHDSYGNLLAAQGRWDDALAMLHRAQEVDPGSVLYVVDESAVLNMARRPNEALDIARQAVELAPEMPYGHDNMGWALWTLGRREEAVAALERAAEVGQVEWFQAMSAYVMARTGRRGQAEHVLREILRSNEARFVSPRAIGLAYAAVGDFDRAIEWFERSIEIREGFIFILVAHPMFDELRDHPGFGNLLRMMNFADASGG